MSQRGKNRGTAEARAAKLEHVRAAAAAKRAELGLEPVAPENLEYGASRAALRTRKRKRR